MSVQRMRLVLNSLQALSLVFAALYLLYHLGALVQEIIYIVEANSMLTPEHINTLSGFYLYYSVPLTYLGLMFCALFIFRGFAFEDSLSELLSDLFIWGLVVLLFAPVALIMVFPTMFLVVVFIFVVLFFIKVGSGDYENAFVIIFIFILVLPFIWFSQKSIRSLWIFYISRTKN